MLRFTPKSTFMIEKHLPEPTSHLRRSATALALSLMAACSDDNQAMMGSQLVGVIQREFDGQVDRTLNTQDSMDASSDDGTASNDAPETNDISTTQDGMMADEISGKVCTGGEFAYLSEQKYGYCSGNLKQILDEDPCATPDAIAELQTCESHALKFLENIDCAISTGKMSKKDVILGTSATKIGSMVVGVTEYIYVLAKALKQNGTIGGYHGIILSVEKDENGKVVKIAIKQPPTDESCNATWLGHEEWRIGDGSSAYALSFWQKYEEAVVIHVKRGSTSLQDIKDADCTTSKMNPITKDCAAKVSEIATFCDENIVFEDDSPTYTQVQMKKLPTPLAQQHMQSIVSAYEKLKAKFNLMPSQP